jgi:membrane protein implicated in regulation of membrane protease activity
MPEALVADGAGWFTVPAVVGTVFFAARLVLMLIVGDTGLDVDVDAEHGDPGEAFKVLSIQSIAAFMMGFGWGGLAGMHAFGWEWLHSLLLGVGFGAAMVWVLALLLKGVHDLQSDGNVRLEAAIGTEGHVYANIPAGGSGRGQVQIVVNGRQRICNAVSSGDAIASQTRTRVVRVNEDRTLTVDPL